MNKRAFFIYPPAGIMVREDRCQQPVEELIVIPPLPPMDLMYMAAVAEKAGYECKIKDYSIKKETLKDFGNDLKEFQPDYIIINVTTSTLENDLKVCDISKQLLPDVKIIAKGAHFLMFAQQTLEDFPSLDMAIKGEPELTLKEVFEGNPLDTIQGLYYREDEVIKTNPDRPFNENLDELPFPARHLVENAIYTRPDNGKVQGVIKVSRGCPFHCFFCLATPVSGSKVRMRSPENIIAEIKECVEKYKITNFIFWSDIFNFNRKWTIELCEAIINSGLKITWSSNTRADTADLEMAKLMYKAGCRLVSIGVESGSQELLEKMGKRTTLEQVRETIKIFRKSKMKIFNYFVIGLPWETEETAEQTIKFAIELDSDFASFYTATAMPGARFYDYANENDLFETDDKQEVYKNAYCYPTAKAHYLSKERIWELQRSAVKRFHLRPQFILRSLFNIRSFSEFKNYFNAGLGILKRK